MRVRVSHRRHIFPLSRPASRPPQRCALATPLESMCTRVTDSPCALIESMRPVPTSAPGSAPRIERGVAACLEAPPSARRPRATSPGHGPRARDTRPGCPNDPRCTPRTRAPPPLTVLPPAPPRLVAAPRFASPLAPPESRGRVAQPPVHRVALRSAQRLLSGCSAAAQRRLSGGSAAGACAAAQRREPARRLSGGSLRGPCRRPRRDPLRGQRRSRSASCAPAPHRRCAAAGCRRGCRGPSALGGTSAAPRPSRPQ